MLISTYLGPTYVSKSNSLSPLRYVVEALDNTTMSPWTPVAETTSGGERKIKCEGLAHRHLYRFRVRAVNKIGQGEPFEMLGDDILIKDPWGNS